eukprot:1138089-Pelagomonas_calceolata.AAC.11
MWLCTFVSIRVAANTARHPSTCTVYHHVLTHLCEQLLEVLKGQLGAVTEGGQGGIVAHAAQGLCTCLCHGNHQHLQPLTRVPARAPHK